MEWISDLIKYLSVSKLFAFALFTTSATLLFGPHYLSSQIPEITGMWKIIALAILIFSGSHLLIWLLQWTGAEAMNIKNSYLFWRKSKNLTLSDKSFIEFIAKHEYETINLLYLDYKKINISKIELMQHARALSRAGLVKISPYDDYIVSLTERGKLSAARIAADSRLPQE